MTARTTFVVQGFEHVDGRLVARRREVVPDESHALRQAEALARRLPGAAALKLLAGEGTVEVATTLGAFGDVPDDLLDGLAGG